MVEPDPRASATLCWTVEREGDPDLVWSPIFESESSMRIGGAAGVVG
jgi:hypothetical protein